jgi:dimethylsulfide dehydrogenase subunit alpha/complex iron-sulfur molybdoenzyme family reductase subunit alpha
MDSSALWADYVLPAASHYEAWDLRTTPLHRFVNVFTAPVPPVGESKPDWDIMVLLTEKLQERARARGFGPYQDGPFERNFATAWDEYTMSGKLLTDYDATSFIAQHSPELGGQSLEEGARRGFFTIGHSPFPEHTNVRPDEPLNPWEKQVVDKKPYPTLSGRITFYCDHDRFIQLGSTVPTARRNAGKEASRYPLTFYTPHTRWGIHSNWRSNKYMLRLQRGEPAVHISPKLAASRGIRDGDLVRVFNGAGSFEARARVGALPVQRESGAEQRGRDADSAPRAGRKLGAPQIPVPALESQPARTREQRRHRTSRGGVGRKWRTA